ncbi:hypothetical protein GQF61_15540 [Sphingobacterium sp. DK4209]|uniref:Uncharacterized protein n=1 Tax=Sphingobacterium zhuxiongii TaxID=2662364 RepID=A0A5Q0QEC0_9SPHI|nr:MULTISPECIES: hypothetical protein [unclassified Sphingobacterium]MVZ67269.1 hypothetical protein [Sphingobacterium sp. DK4209]QGA27614.1 hypothetical protein GFH32_15375 [Sphingobacterium sp. dk4302]
MKTFVASLVLMFGLLTNSQAQNKENILPTQQKLPHWADSVKINIPKYKIMSTATPNMKSNDSMKTNPVEIPNSFNNRRMIGKDDSIILIKPLDGSKNSPMPGTELLNKKR